MARKGKWYAGAIVFLAVLAVTCEAERHHKHILRTTVRFLATSTRVHSADAPNQDVYLIELTATKAGERQTIASLVDEYPPWQAALTVRVLTAQAGVVLRLSRDTDCDIPLAQMPLRAAPGDPMAILPERLGYEPKLPFAIQPDIPLPCYRLVRP